MDKAEIENYLIGNVKLLSKLRDEKAQIKYNYKLYDIYKTNYITIVEFIYDMFMAQYGFSIERDRKNGFFVTDETKRNFMLFCITCNNEF